MPKISVLNVNVNLQIYINPTVNLVNGFDLVKMGHLQDYRANKLEKATLCG